MRDTRKRLLVICPVYNEEENIAYFFGRLQAVFAATDQTRYNCLLLFTNNRSADGTLDRIRALEAQYAWVNHLTLSRNFGYQLSVLSGLCNGDADLYMICDVDCEDPPELLHTFLAAIEGGADLAYGIRNNRPDSWLMARCRRLFYYLLKFLGDNQIVPYMAEFAMSTRHVRDALVSNVSTFPFIRAEVGYVGFHVVGVPYRREDRAHGVTHYNYVGNFRFAIAGILSSTTFPLRAALYLLPIVLGTIALSCLLYFAHVARFETTILAIISISTAYGATGIAFQSIYLARTYQNGLGRKRFIVDQSHTNLSAHEKHDPMSSGRPRTAAAIGDGTPMPVDAPPSPADG
jgi:glycosyltransferase involved in cell wall biosynthesis